MQFNALSLMCYLLHDCENQIRGGWNVYFSLNLVSARPSEQSKPLRKIPVL